MAPSAILEYPNNITTKLKEINLINLDHGDHEIKSNGLASKTLIQRVLKEQISSIDTDTCEPGDEDAFYVADLGEIYRQHIRWKMNLSRVKPFYGTSLQFSDRYVS